MPASRPDVLLVTPPSRVRVYQQLSSEYAAIEPPVWSGLIAQFLRRRDVDVQMLDAEAEGLTSEDTAERIAAVDPTLIVYMIYGQQPSASTQCMPAGSDVASRVNARSDRPSLVVGTHASRTSRAHAPRGTLHVRVPRRGPVYRPGITQNT